MSHATLPAGCRPSSHRATAQLDDHRQLVRRTVELSVASTEVARCFCSGRCDESAPCSSPAPRTIPFSSPLFPFATNHSISTIVSVIFSGSYPSVVISPTLLSPPWIAYSRLSLMYVPLRWQLSFVPSTYDSFVQVPWLSRDLPPT